VPLNNVLLTVDIYNIPCTLPNLVKRIRHVKQFCLDF